MLQLKIQNVADEFTSRAAVRNFECSAWQPDLRLLWNTSILQRQRTTSDFRMLISAARICDRTAGLFTSLAVGMLAGASDTHHADRITDLRLCREARFARCRLGLSWKPARSIRTCAPKHRAIFACLLFVTSAIGLSRTSEPQFTHHHDDRLH